MTVASPFPVSADTAGGGGERPRFTIGPLSMAIELTALEVWLAGSVPGDRITYATGPDLPRSAATVKRVTVLAEARRVRPLRTKIAGGWDFMVERLADPAAPAAPAPAGTLDDVLRLIRLAINLGKPCPTNAEIATACGLPNADAASYLFKKLVKSGVLISTDHGPRMRRVVRVAGGSKCTPEARL